MDRDLFSLSRDVEILQLEVPRRFVGAAHELARINGWLLQINELPDSEGIEFADIMIQMADEICRVRGSSLRSFRDGVGPDISWQAQPFLKTRKCVIWGRSALTESIEMHLMLLDYRARIETDLSRMSFGSDEIVIVDNCSRGAEIVANAVYARAPHVAMVGTADRAREVIKYLNRSPEKISEMPIYVPAGVDLKARNHDEVALSIVVEILLRGNHA
ncbi:XdhC family protein [Bdellovibrio sp. HCB209]|uniref:XdhC family protein n=1 Tax=Bdellovibrio sp. HCB209 TaxID=3394354 RepID=UPI0039B44CD0